METTPPETGYSNLTESTVVEIPIPPSHQIPEHTSDAPPGKLPVETALQCYAEAVGRTLRVISRTSAQLWDGVRGYTEDSYSQVERETRILGKRAQENASYVRERYPLEALGAIAGAAFLVGIGLRVWGSRGE